MYYTAFISSFVCAFFLYTSEEWRGALSSAASLYAMTPGDALISPDTNVEI